MTIGRNAAIQVQAQGGKRGYGIYNTYGTTELGDGASIQLDTAAVQNAAVFSAAKGSVIFDGGLKVRSGANQDALSAKAEGTITAVGAGAKQIDGNLLSAGGGTINLNLNTADSLLRGKSAVESANNLSGVLTKGTTNLTLTNGARWDMTGDSIVTTLDHENDGIVNMAYNPSYQNLDVGSYAGKNGLFLMKTDLDSQKDGDKVHMDRAASGSEGKIQVEDTSFLTGKEVTGNRHLLLVTDDSKNATFTGMTLDKGGLWDVTPTIQNGKFVREEMGDGNAKDTEWYLTKLTKNVNPGTRTLLKSVDNTYALYRDSLDTLRQRMGDLRLRDKKSEVSGLWARNSYGAYAGGGLENKENRFQLGYDWSADRKSVYGILGERGIGNPSYTNGSGRNHSLAGAVYGTWFGDNGSYTDVVGKIGRDDAQVRTYGAYADKADYRTHEASVSVEYGRTHKLNDRGLFLEPETQLVWGHLGNTHYTTERGKDVTLSGYNSAIGRLGFVFGQRRTDIRKPFDYYLKANVLHEFGGGRALHLAAQDGETMDTKADYRDTWFELGLGGTARLNKATYLYADVSRTYGSEWNQKWRWNVGVDWTF
ncbi:MAG: autotransporter outer membrane beta-barrel domain-containing protein [Acidaminococcus sp.]|uniref:autotransporter outer membrane beta-barrel domain-containing protein n=1 Tax=Acidaminococcus sp. TaxID=1872103 RepID=UPI003F1528A4